jgi:D-serine deaminase-like pyridoxal phosphate-dependent protein
MTAATQREALDKMNGKTDSALVNTEARLRRIVELRRAEGAAWQALLETKERTKTEVEAAKGAHEQALDALRRAIDDSGQGVMFEEPDDAAAR